MSEQQQKQILKMCEKLGRDNCYKKLLQNVAETEAEMKKTIGEMQGILTVLSKYHNCNRKLVNLFNELSDSLCALSVYETEYAFKEGIKTGKKSKQALHS